MSALPNKMYLLFISIILCAFDSVISHDFFDIIDYATNYPPTCYRKIFCDSVLLHDVALSGIDKGMNVSYVRKKLRFPEEIILERYEFLRESNGGNALSRLELLQFIQDHFEDPQELVDWLPNDYKEETALMERVRDTNYQNFLRSLQGIWRTLCKMMVPDVALNADSYSLIYVPNGFCAPGGQFREMFYWDTYWVADGLLLSDMASTVRGIIENFLSLIRRFKFVPSATRVFYLSRSQPPLLIQMVDNYLQHTGNLDFVWNNLLALTNEFEWWQENRGVKFVKDDKSYILFRYDSRSRGPRPETYINDWKIGSKIQSKIERERFYSDIKSATESGWDFSTRWFKNETKCATLRDVKTSLIVPVDLNAILQKNAVLLSEWWFTIGDPHKGEYYKELADQLLESIHEVFWREDLGSWFDWDLMNHKHRTSFYPSNLVPLWTESYSMPKSHVAAKVIQYLKKEQILCADGTPRFIGIPTSLTRSGQQWDFPNAWAPLQMFVIQGLDRTGEPEAQAIAEQLAQNWVYTNYIGFLKSGVMYEKYDAVQVGVAGGGGEYAVQTGFGWTNGVVISLLNRYSDTLSPGRNRTC